MDWRVQQDQLLPNPYLASQQHLQPDHPHTRLQCGHRDHRSQHLPAAGGLPERYS